ncbi:MAG: N-acetylmuramoyl-L-alanine amidase family protein [Evtepia sp.]
MPAQTQRTQPKRPPARRKRRRRRQFPLRPVIFVLVLLVVVGIILNLTTLGQMMKLARDNVPRWVDVQIIDVNGSGRRGERLSGVNDIVIHYVGNPGTTAQQNHDFFDQPDTTVSAHFLVGLDGEIIQCIPLDEVSSASNDRNSDTISIEVCHPDATGQFNQKTYDSLVKLTAWLCDYCDIGRDHVIRHYDVTGKLCPLYFVEHPDAWEQFLVDVKKE